MKFFALPNLSSQDVVEVEPSATKHTGYPDGDKKSFRAWCANKETKHCFYTAAEGLIPSLRVTKENPAVKLHGLVLDYDCEIDDEMEKSIAKISPADLAPTWVSTTRSGGRRLIFEFESPMPVENKQLYEQFIKRLAKELRAYDLLPSLDNKSFELTQLFELGTNWRKLPGGKPISKNRLGLILFEAAKEKIIAADGPNIPIEAIAEEVEKRWPGRIQGEFVVGLRTPLFWLDDGIDRIGAQVGDYGMICYSDRAGKSFLHWGEILGPEFMRNFEAEKLGRVIENWWYIGKEKCYLNDSDGVVGLPLNYTQLARHLRNDGLDPRLPKHETISEVDQAVTIIEKTKQVYGAAPFPFNPEKRIWLCGKTYLNTSTLKAVEPAASGEPADFPFIWEFQNKIWSPDYPIQRLIFLFWHKRFYKTCLNNAPEMGQALFVESAPGRGKTFLSHRLVGDSVGGHIDAAKFLLNKTVFNEEAGHTALWAVDDEMGSKTWEEHTQMSAALKKYTATPEFRMEAKFKDAITREFYGRILVTCNDTPEGRNILPIVDESIDDKLIFLRFGNWQPPFSNIRRENDARVRKELPYYLAWMLKQKAPPEITDNATRYGIIPWKHPEMKRAAYQSSQSAQLSELLGIWVEKRVNDKKLESKWFSALGLLGEMGGIDEIRGQLRSFAANRMGRALAQLKREKSPWIKGDRILHGETQYLLSLCRPD
jgi:uncharacterized protein DUF5906